MNIRLDGYSEEQVLRYVLAGLETERDRIEGNMELVRGQLREAGNNSGPARRTPAQNVVRIPVKQPGGRRPLSKAARESIAAAQRKRWAKHNREKRAAAKAAAAKPRRTKGQKLPLAQSSAETEAVQ